MATLETHSSFQLGGQPKKPSSWLGFRSSLSSPAIVFLVVLSQIPVAFTLYYSLSNWNLLRPERTRFVGLSNYTDFVQDSDVITIVRNTLVFSSSVVLLSLIIGMILALLLNRQFFGRGFARTLLITPFLIMPTVSAVMWKNMLFNPAFGLISSCLLYTSPSPRDGLLSRMPSSA